LHLLLLHLLLHLLGLLFELVAFGLEFVNLGLRLFDPVAERVLFAAEHIDCVLLRLLGGVVPTERDDDLVDVLHLRADVRAAAERDLNRRARVERLDGFDGVVDVCLLFAVA